MKQTRKIEVVPYNPLWPKQFEEQAEFIKKALGNHCLQVHHVGSTSVPGLPAKPKIDIVAVVKHPFLEEDIKKLEAAHFVYRGEYNIPMHFGFSKRGPLEVNLHVYEEGHPEIELNLTFRDYLKTHPAMRDEYGALKLHLLEKESSFEKDNSMFTGYNLGKDALIRKILKLANFKRLRFVKCAHHAEWEACKKFRQKYFFDKVPIQDPYQWTFNHPEHAHFALCLGTEVIGYAHVELWHKSRAALRIIVVEEGYRNKGYGSQLLQWTETWLKSKGCHTLHTESRPEALSFYKHRGYVPMPFNDPHGHATHPNDTPLGKQL